MDRTRRPDFDKKKPPDYQPRDRAQREWMASPATSRSSCIPTVSAWLYVTSGLKDGPLPTHYEPLESPFGNALYPEQATIPRPISKSVPTITMPTLGDERFPYVLTTYRLTEHHTAGGMSRQLSHLAELQPEFFCEVSPELAADASLEHGDWATIMTPRGIVEARVLVTPAHAAAVGRRPHRASGRAAVSLGL